MTTATNQRLVLKINGRELPGNFGLKEISPAVRCLRAALRGYSPNGKIVTVRAGYRYKVGNFVGTIEVQNG